jgi:hypothetical protein
MRRLLEKAVLLWRKIEDGMRKHAPVLAFTCVVLYGVLLAGHPAQASGLSSSDVGKYLGEAVSIIFTIVAGIAAGLLMMVIPLLIAASQYGNFINATPVVAGWVVMRDFTNLLFILVLLVIAFGIIFNQEKWGKISMIPQMFIMAIAINFSRTITGFLIDVSQVFMLTFLNAIKDAGAGNLVDLFSVGGSVDLASSDTVAIGAVVDGVLKVVVARFASALTLIIALVIIGYLAIFMMYRIVALWILIVISPLVWFTKIIENWGIHAWSDWWSELKKQLITGPIMAFFLWLALATAAGGSADFVNYSDAAGNHLDANQSYAAVDSATMKSMVKAIIAIAILFKGLEIAEKASGGQFSGASGVLKKGGSALSGAAKGAAIGIAGGAAGWAARGALRGGSWAVSGGAAASGRGKFSSGMLELASAPNLRAAAMKKAGTAIAGLSENRSIGGRVLRTAIAAGSAGVLTGGTLRNAGASIIDKGSAMTKETEDQLKKAITAGGPEIMAMNMRRLREAGMDKSGAFNIESLSGSDKESIKALTKAVEDDPKAFGKLSDGEKMQYLETRSAITNAIKDRTARDSALHHDEEFTVKNVHAFAAADQVKILDHLPKEFVAKASGQTFTMDDKIIDQYKKEAATGFVTPDTAKKYKAEQDRVGANLTAAVKKNAEAMAARANSDGAILTALQSSDKGTFEAVFATGRISPKNMDKAWGDALTGEQAKIVMQYADDADRKDLDKNKPLKDSIVGGLEKWKSDPATAGLSSPERGAGGTTPFANTLEARQIMRINLDVQKARSAATPGAPALDTLGIDAAGGMSSFAVANLSEILSTNSDVADVIISVPETGLTTGRSSTLIQEHLNVGALTELAKRKVEGKLNKDEIEKVTKYLKYLTGPTVTAPPGSDMKKLQDAIDKTDQIRHQFKY